jgi:hypothetical protein
MNVDRFIVALPIGLLGSRASQIDQTRILKAFYTSGGPGRRACQSGESRRQPNQLLHVSESLHRLCGTLPQVWRRLGAPTPPLFYGLDETDETAEDIDKGKTLVVRKPGQKVVKDNPLVSIETMTIVFD